MDAPEDRLHRGSIELQVDAGKGWADQWTAGIAFSDVDHVMDDALRQTSAMAPAGRDYFMLTEAQSGYAGAYIEASKEYRDNAFLRYGADLQRRTWNADNEIAMLENNMLPDVSVDQAGIWAVHESVHGPWALEVGARIDLSTSRAKDPLNHIQTIRGTNTNRQEDLLPSAYAMVSRDFGESLNLYSGIGYATRSPDPQERYMNLNRPMGSDWVGNPNLDPVHNLEWQSGYIWQRSELTVQGSAFYAWLNDLIYLEALTGPDATSYTNINARLYGCSIDGTWTPSENITLQAGIAWQQGEKTTRPNTATNDVLGEIPPLKGRLSMDWSDNGWSFASELLFQDRYDRIDPNITEKTISGWAVLNLVGSYQFNDRAGITIGIDNLFDKKYAVANAFVRDPFRNGLIVNEPGRFYYLRLDAAF